jgi:hypothetical protein
MGILVDFLVASMDDLRTACRGWKEPLATPVKRSVVNPFTGQAKEYLTTDPDRREPFPPDTVRSPDLSRCRRVELKGLKLHVEVNQLILALGATDEEIRTVYDVPLYGSPETKERISRVPSSLVERLARMSPDEVVACAQRWDAKVSGEPGHRYLGKLAELAQEATSENQPMFIWMSPPGPGVMRALFVASMDELRVACPGWKEPLVAPVKRKTVNPFTKEVFEVLTTAPDPTGFASDARGIDLSRLQPMWLRALGATQMEHLMRVALHATDEEVKAVHDAPLHRPPKSNQFISRVPDRLVQRLAQMSQDELVACGDAFAFGVRLSQHYLGSLAELARTATAENRQMFLWESP